MMQFPKAKIEAASKVVNENGTFEVTFNETNIFVIGESSQMINEFESQLAAHCMEWDNGTVDGDELLRILTDIQGNRTDFRSRYNDEWQARYEIVAA